jgi:hypothetical protein
VTATEHRVVEGPDVVSSAATQEDETAATLIPGRRSAARALVLAGVAYLALSVGLWWHVWTGHPTTTTTCGCGDSSLFQWFLAWPAYAISHGLNPLYSTALFHPQGVNLLSNTAVVGFGVVLAPVTWLAGPVATFNVTQTLAPALSAFTMFLFLRRWVSWTPAAFFGGLLFGFSPFVLIGLTDGHLMLTMAAMFPVMLLILDDLLARQRWHPVVSGAALAVAVAVQFFFGTELLLMVGLMAALGIAAIVVYLAIARRDVLVRRWRHAALGLAVAAGVAGVLLAYPVWFALAGPGHLAGPIWGPRSIVSYGGTNAHDYVLPGTPSTSYVSTAHRLGGYQAPTLSGQYIGIGLLAVLIIGLVIWRRDLRLWLFAGLGAVSVPLSMGLSVHGTWTLWSVFVHLPLMENVIPSRFLLVTFLCAAVMLGLILDHVWVSVGAVAVRRRRSSRGTAQTGPRRTAVVASGVGVAVALLALVPIAGYYADGVPFTTQPVVLPTWYRTVAPHLTRRSVLLAYPPPFALLQSTLTWQAVSGMSFSQASGGGPGALPIRSGGAREGQVYLGNLSISGGHPIVRPAGVQATRKALDIWGVTTVVIPDPDGLPLYEQVRALRSSVVLVTAATGRTPVRQAGAWVWSVPAGSRPSTATAVQLAVCNAGPEHDTVASIRQSAACVLALPNAAS